MDVLRFPHRERRMQDRGIAGMPRNRIIQAESGAGGVWQERIHPPLRRKQPLVQSRQHDDRGIFSRQLEPAFDFDRPGFARRRPSPRHSLQHRQQGHSIDLRESWKCRDLVEQGDDRFSGLLVPRTAPHVARPVDVGQNPSERRCCVGRGHGLSQVQKFFQKRRKCFEEMLSGFFVIARTVVVEADGNLLQPGAKRERAEPVPVIVRFPREDGFDP